jgi:hypothetical protein
VYFLLRRLADTQGAKGSAAVQEPTGSAMVIAAPSADGRGT